MQIQICERMRQLRHEKGNTQEQLAKHLGISTQAVSKWERGEGHPDITLLPAIAFFYDVTVDDLLGVGELQKQAKIAEYEAKRRALVNQGKNEACLALCREAQKEFPNEPEVIVNLMYALRNVSVTENSEEIIALGKWLLQNSNRVSDRFGAVQCLCYTYKELDNLEEAKKYAAMAGRYWVTENQLMSNIVEGEEGILWCQGNITTLVDLIAINVNRMLNKGKFDTCEHIKACEFVLQLYGLLYEDGDYGFYHCRIFEWSIRLAKLYAKEGKVPETICWLSKTVEHAIAYDALTVGVHTSLLVNRCKYNAKESSKNYKENNAMLCLQEMQDGCFDSVRGEEKFAEIESRLKQVARG